MIYISKIELPYRPGEPVHIQYNSTAFFDDKSINIATPKTLFTVLEQSLMDSQSYTNDLQSKLYDVNPFSSTITAIFTDPKNTPVTRSSAKSILGITSAGLAAALTFTMAVGVVLLRERKTTDDNDYDESLKKKINEDTTVAGETFVSETNTGSDGSCLSLSSSTGSKINYQVLNSTFSVEERINTTTPRGKPKETRMINTSNWISTPKRKPRSVADIERLLSLGDGDMK